MRAARSTGPDFQIGADVGTLAGRNLFRSFEPFSLATGGRATFSEPDEVRNVISRLTGGARSAIDGSIHSTIPGGDFHFLNPAGIAFGPTPRRLDLQARSTSRPSITDCRAAGHQSGTRAAS